MTYYGSEVQLYKKYTKILQKPELNNLDILDTHCHFYGSKAQFWTKYEKYAFGVFKISGTEQLFPWNAFFWILNETIGMECLRLPAKDGKITVRAHVNESAGFGKFWMGNGFFPDSKVHLKEKTRKTTFTLKTRLSG